MRFWNLFQADFSHDELSALFRTQFDSFESLIEKAVRPDGHPALVQTFLYYWAPLVEYQEFWVKLPSVLLGLGSISLVYFGLYQIKPKSGMRFIAPSIMAASELFVYHHQVARPYAFGAFFVAWAGYSYLKWFYGERYKRYLIQFTIAASLAAYTHYLALLSVLIIGFSALIRDRKKPKPWLFTGLIVLLLFSPHLGIFWDQLQMAGVGQWLGKPSADWFLRYFFYKLNFTPQNLFLSGLILFIVLYEGLRSPFREGPLWLVSCFLIAFFYSILRNPVLQYSSLLFLAPFLFIFRPIKSEANWKWIAMSLFIMLGLGLSLVFNRKYYQEAQISPAKEAARFRGENDSLNLYFHWSPEKWDFYRKINYEVPEGQYVKELDFTSLPEEGFFLVMDHQSPAYWPLAITDLGYEVLQQENHFGFSIYKFGGLHDRDPGQYLGLPLMEPSTLPQQNKRYVKLGTLKATSSIASMPQSHVVVKLDSLNLAVNCFLVFQILEGDEQKEWYAHPIDSSTEYLSRPIGQYDLEKYTWNILLDKGRVDAQAEGEIFTRVAKGNPKIYGLVQEF